MEEISTFLENAHQFYFYLAIAGSTIFIIQLAMVLIGAGGEFDSDASGNFDQTDVDMIGSGDLSLVSFFSIRSLIAFITFFGWAGFFWGDTLTGTLISLACGILMMTLTTLVVYFFIRMQQSGNIANSDFLEKSGTVYISIPGGREASGVVTVKFDNCTRQVKAFAQDEIPAGTPIKIVAMIGENNFTVEKI